MESSENSRKLTSVVFEPARERISRRMVLGLGCAFGAATPFAMIGAARALTALRGGSFPELSE